MLQLVGNLIKPVGRPVFRLFGFGRQRQNNGRHIIDPASDNQRIWNTNGQAYDIGADFFMDPQHRGVLIGANKKARSDNHPIVERVGIDMLDTIDAFDNIFQRTRDQLHRISGFIAIRNHHNINHRYADLRLFLTRQREQSDRADNDRTDEQQRRERR